MSLHRHVASSGAQTARCCSLPPPLPASVSKVQVKAVAQLSPGVPSHIQGAASRQAGHVVPAPALVQPQPGLPAGAQQQAGTPPFVSIQHWQQQQPHLLQQQQQQQQQQQAHVQSQQQLSPQQHHVQQHQHVPLAWASAPQQQVRPVHAQQHVQQMLQLVLSCDNLLKLQAVLSIHLHQFTPSCITTAMQHLHKLRQQELQQPTTTSSSGDMGPVLQAVQLQLAGQMTQALLRQLPVVSGSCLAAFLAAAASMRLVMPDAVLEQIAAHLVNKALRLACQQQQHTAAAAAATNQQPVATSTSSAATNQQQDTQQQQERGSSQPLFADSSQQQQRSQPHVAALSAWALAKLKLRSGPLWSELVSIAGEQLPSMAPNDCVMLAHACAKAGQHQPRLFNAVAQQLRPHAARLPPESISRLLWSYAAAGQYHQGWVSVLVSAAADKMERFSPRQLATSLWACGRLRHADPRMLSALRVQALACMSDTGHMALSNLAWSLATLGVADEALAAAIVSRAAQLAGGFHMQGLANVAWAVVKLQQQLKHTHRAQPHARVNSEPSAQLGAGSSCRSSSNGLGSQQPPESSQHQLWHAAHGLLEVLCSVAGDKVHSAQPQEVCNLLWACATLQHKHDAFFTAASVRLVVVAEDAAPIDLAQAMWALETLRFRRNTTQQALLKAALNKLHLFGPQALSNLAWAVAASGMRHPPGLPEAVAQQLQALLPKMTPQGQATTLWALSKLGPVPQQLIHAASSHISAQLPMYNAHDLCNVAMVAAKAGYKEPQLLQDLAAAANSAAAVTLSAWQGSSQAVSLSGEAPPVCSASRAPHKRLTQQGVCNLVWAFAGTGWCDAQLMRQLQRVSVLHLPRLQPRSLAALCQGFALLGQPLDDLLAAMTGAAQAQRNKPKQRKQQAPSLQYQQNVQRLEGLQARLGAEPTASQLQAQAQIMQQQLASWSADSLALLLHALVVTGAHDRQAAIALAALRLLTRRGAAESLSQQRQRQLHMALTRLALQWGVASAGQQDRRQVRFDKSPASSGSRMVSGAHSRMRQPSLVQQLLGEALVVDGEASSCSGTDGCAAGEQGPQPARPATLPPAAEVQGVAQAPHGAAYNLADATLPAAAAVAAAVDAVAPQPGLDISDLPGLAAALLTGGLAQVCLRSWQQHEAVKQLSRVEQEATRVLQSMGLQPLTQHWLQLTYTQPHSQQLGGPAGAAAQWTSRALAVNVGLAAPSLGPGRSPLALCVLPPASLSSSWPRQVLGQTRLELSCLQAAGWQVVELSWEDWDSLGGNIAQQQGLLTRLCGV